MQSLPWSARVYMLLCYLVGALACAWLMLSPGARPGLEDWLLGAALAAVAATCQIFVIKRAGTNHSDHLTQAPLFAAMLLLPRPVVACVLIITFLPEWFVYHRKWFIQSFNISSYFVASALAYILQDQLFGQSPKLLVQSFSWSGIIILGLVFLLVQTLLVSLVLLLARRQSIRESGLFAPAKLSVEGTLLAVGASFAVCWNQAPMYGLIAAVPLLLIFRALHVPNLIEEAATDPKTGLANMRHFNAVIQRDIERAERGGHHASLLMCDLDYLRNINNTYGHQAGDEVLLGIADIIRRTISGKDIAARFGGEEFLIFLAETDAQAAHELAERIRSELEQAEFDSGLATPIRATISIGAATFPHDGRTIEILTREADLAVYQAKRDGRNQVAVAGRMSRELAGEWAREHLVGPAVSATVPQEGAPRWKLVSEVTRDRINSDTRSGVARQRKAARTRPSAATRKAGPGITPAMYALIAAVFMGGLASLWGNLAVVGMPWLSLLLFLGLTVIAEQFAVDTGGRGKTSVAIVVVLAATFLFGSVGVAVTALALAVSVAIKARSPLNRVLFNLGTVLLSGQAAHLVFSLSAPGGLTAPNFPRTILPAMVAGLTYYVVNHALLCVIRGLHERRAPLHIWQSDYRWLWPHYIVLGALALVVALGNVLLGWLGVIALMAPVGMMHFAIKQYMGRTTLHLDELQRMNGRLTDSYEATLQALSRALDTRDEETEEHSQRVKRYTGLIATQLGVPDDEREDMLRGALLHDIGKIGVPDAILLKPGRLTPDEIAVMRKHPEIGYGMIAHIPFLSNAAQVVLHHHESYDGRGYPSGLSGATIPLGARIFAVADTFDAMTSDRPYRSALPIETAMEELRVFSGKQFDPAIVEAFMQLPISDLLDARNGQPMPAIAPDRQLEPQRVLVTA